jgi:hypothetical protein
VGVTTIGILPKTEALNATEQYGYKQIVSEAGSAHEIFYELLKLNFGNERLSKDGFIIRKRFEVSGGAVTTPFVERNELASHMGDHTPYPGAGFTSSNGFYM